MRLSVIAMFVVAPLLTTGCDRDRDRIGTGEQGAVEAGEIAKRPDSFYGRLVTVVAEVEEVYTPNAFSLDDDEALAGPDVLVLVPQPARPVEEDEEVRVQGTVRPLIVAELERDYAWFRANKYDQQLLVRFKERPVIVADSVRDDERGDLIAGTSVRPPAVAPPSRANQPPAENQPPPTE